LNCSKWKKMKQSLRWSQDSSTSNSLNALGKTYTQVEIVRKALGTLTPEWEKQTIAIEEANDLSTLTLENLVGNLMAYKVQVQERKKDEQSQPKKKLIAFKASSDSEDSDGEEEDMAMITTKFRKFLRKAKFNKFKDTNEVPLCFKCSKLGHMKKIVPYLSQKSTSTNLTSTKKEEGLTCNMEW